MPSAYSKYRKTAVKGFIWPTVLGGGLLAAAFAGRKKKDTISNPATEALNNRQKQLEEANRLAADPTGTNKIPGG